MPSRCATAEWRPSAVAPRWRRSSETGRASSNARATTILPGFVDSHIQPVFGIELTRGRDLSGCRTLD